MYVFIYVIFTATVSHADANVTASPNQPNTTSTASTTKITPGTIPNPETANPYLLKLWKYSVRGRVNESFIADLNNADSQTFKRASDRINTELKQLFSGYGLNESYVLGFSSKSYDTLYDALLYFHVSSQINTTQMKNDVNRQKSSVLGTVVTKELCAEYTCTNATQGTCTYVEGVAICSCKIGFRGIRCEGAYTVNGTVYSQWTDWTPCTKSCDTGEQKRRRVCKPKPINGGVCVIGPYEELVNRTCNTERCPRKHDDDDYYLIAYICGGVFLAVLILLIAFCCTHQYTKYGVSDPMKHEEENRSPRNQPIIKRPSKSYSSHSSYIRSENVVPLHKLAPTPPETSPRDSGFDNFAYRDHEHISDSEEVYKLQIQKFLQQAPALRHNVLSRSNSYDREGSVISANASRSPAIINRSRPQPTARPRPSEIGQKIIDRGPSRYQLVMI